MLIEILNVFAAVERKLKNVSYCQHFQVETMMESAFKSQHDLLLGGVYMTPGRLSRRDEFTPVPSHGSTFV